MRIIYFVFLGNFKNSTALSDTDLFSQVCLLFPAGFFAVYGVPTQNNESQQNQGTVDNKTSTNVAIVMVSLYSITSMGGIFALICLFIVMCRREERHNIALLLLFTYSMLSLTVGILYIVLLVTNPHSPVLYLCPICYLLVFIFMLTDWLIELLWRYW